MQFRFYYSGAILLLLCLAAHQSFAQGFGSPLTMQGIDHRTLSSSTSLATGNTIFGLQTNIEAMLVNPASLGRVNGIMTSVGSILRQSTSKQEQRYSPLKYYSNFSLFMEGLTRDLPNPAYDTINHVPSTAADTVQRPFDAIGPNWERSQSSPSPVQLFAAVPVSVGGVKLAIGGGMTQYADLHYYFQNNNVLSPSVLTPELYVRTRPINDADSSSRPVQWYQQTVQRDGSITSYGVALSIALSEHWQVGFSGQVLDGSSDDREQRMERGRIRFFQNYFRAESVYYRVTTIGTSSYTGNEMTVSAAWQTQTVLFGCAVQLPSTIERTFSSVQTIDTAGGVRTAAIRGTDKMNLPVRARVAVGLQLRENVEVGAEYEYYPTAESEYTASGGTKSRPWFSSGSLHVGARYRAFDWLVLRAGAMEQYEVFEQLGNPLPGTSVSSTAYTAGLGVLAEGFTVNVSYQYESMKYIDAWTGAVSINSFTGHSFGAMCAYEIPW